MPTLGPGSIEAAQYIPLQRPMLKGWCFMSQVGQIHDIELPILLHAIPTTAGARSTYNRRFIDGSGLLLACKPVNVLPGARVLKDVKAPGERVNRGVSLLSMGH